MIPVLFCDQGKEAKDMLEKSFGLGRCKIERKAKTAKCVEVIEKLASKSVLISSVSVEN